MVALEFSKFFSSGLNHKKLQFSFFHNLTTTSMWDTNFQGMFEAC